MALFKFGLQGLPLFGLFEFIFIKLFNATYVFWKDRVEIFEMWPRKQVPIFRYFSAAVLWAGPIRRMNPN